MKLVSLPPKAAWDAAIDRAPRVERLEEQVKEVFASIQSQGDAALRAYTAAWDGIQRDSVWANVPSGSFAALPSALQNALQQAAQNIRNFHSAQRPKTVQIETQPGVKCWRSYRPLERVGLYVPGGSAPLVSSLLMLAIPAQVAGCKELLVCTPPNASGALDPAIAGACEMLGIDRVVLAGGAQAIAALALGTGSISKVDLIAGPGNQYVTEAKRLAQAMGTRIDLLAGPSELLVIGDGSTPAAFAAADLLSQAEHGSDSQVVLLSTSADWGFAVVKAVEQQLATLPRKAVASRALENSRAYVVKDLDTAFEFANTYAPEHLILASTQAQQWEGRVQAAGSVFLGPWTPESVGDYASGTNHTLPTGGLARSIAGVSTQTFLTSTTFQELTESGLQQLAETVKTLARTEGLEAHARAVSVRTQITVP